jgi:hypothetical protein
LRKAIALGVVITTQAIVTGCVLAASDAYSGHWMYQQTCGWEHVATLDLEQIGNTVTGKWSDGTRVHGSEGSLKGELRDGTLYARFCGVDESSGYSVCPKFDSEVSDHLVRRGSTLVWYQGSGKQFDEYLVLHPAVHGNASVKDNNCSNDAE